MQTAIKTTYDTRTPRPERDRAYYLQRHLRRKGLLRGTPGGRLARFREISKHKRVSIGAVLRGQLDRVFESEYLFYQWNVHIMCAYCGVRLTRRTMTRDHVIPASRGGTSEPSNLVPCCEPCNRAKANRSLLRFLVRRRHRRDIVKVAS